VAFGGEMLRPWWIEDSVEFVESFLNKDMEAFEWGSGRSTVWLAQRVGFVWTVEHQNQWVDKVIAMAKLHEISNYEILKRDSKDVLQYSNAISSVPYLVSPSCEKVSRMFDCVIVDGRNRVACMRKMIPFLKKTCVVVVDDTHRNKYFEGLELLGRDWNHTTFLDPAPKKNKLTKRTTVFWRGFE
jgi:hypothetical protein